MTNFIDAVGLGEGARACRYLTSFLRGEALTWWRSYSGDDLAVYDHLTLDVLVDEIRANFSDIDADMKMRERLFNLKQTGSVMSFVTQFKRI